MTDNKCKTENEEERGSKKHIRSVSKSGNEPQIREVSPNRRETPNREQSNDAIWQKYLSMVADEKGATTLRSDSNFLDNLLKVLETNINEIVRVK